MKQSAQGAAKPKQNSAVQPTKGAGAEAGTGAGAASTEDKRLERLYDYTKFHLGIYLSVASGLAAMFGLVVDGKLQAVEKFIGYPLALLAASLLLFLAGISGGVIASSATQKKTFEEVWTEKIGPMDFTPMTGESWARIEHLAFWAAVALLMGSIIAAAPIRKLLGLA